MSNDLTLTLDDKELMARFAEVDRAIREEAGEAGLRAAANYLVGVIKVNITLKKLIDTGNMLNSTTVEDPVITDTEGYIEFGPHTVYAAIHEFGGIILPINGPYLVFMGKDGHLVKTKSVHMPARPYLRPALDEHGDEAIALLASTISGIIEQEWNK